MRALLVSVLLLGCASTPPTRIEIPMVESWASHARILLLGVPAPDPLEVGEGYRVRISLLHRPTEIRYMPLGRSLLEPIEPGLVREIPWVSPILSTVHLNIERFLAEGIVGIAPMRSDGEIMHIRYCPREMLYAGYTSNSEASDFVRLYPEPEWHTDPEYGCLYHLSRSIHDP